MSAVSISGSAGRNARLPEEAQGILGLHDVDATSLPACSRRWTQGGWGRPEGAGPRARVFRAGWRWRFMLAAALSLELAGWRAIRMGGGL